MPTYQVTITNVSDTRNTDKSIGSFYVETVSAPDVATVEKIILHDLNRVVDADLYSWTIEQTAP